MSVHVTATGPIAMWKPQKRGRDCAAYLLRASLVDDLRVVLRLVAILPGKVDGQLTRLLVVTGVDGLDLILPRADGRFPRSTAHRGSCRSRVTVIPFLLGSVSRGGRAGPTTLFGLDARLGLLQNLLLATDGLEVFFEYLGSVLPGEGVKLR